MAKAENTKSLRRKVRNSYIISTISIALVLFLLGSVGYLIFNAVRATDLMKENVAIHLMIKQGTSDERIAEIGRELGAHEAVKEVTFVPKAVAAENFKEQIGSDFVEFLAFNPLPDAYEVKLHAQYSDKDYVRKFEKEAASWNGIEEVVYQRAVVEQIGSNINKFNLVLLLFGGALLVIALILLNNTIRLTIYSKRYLINTMKLVGASKWFIMKPFLLRSILHGVYAWLIAAAMFLALVAGLGEGLPEVTFLAESQPVYYVLCGMLLLGILISALFTLFAVNKFVRMNTTKSISTDSPGPMRHSGTGKRRKIRVNICKIWHRRQREKAAHRPHRKRSRTAERGGGPHAARTQKLPFHAHRTGNHHSRFHPDERRRQRRPERIRLLDVQLPAHHARSGSGTRRIRIRAVRHHEKFKE